MTELLTVSEVAVQTKLSAWSVRREIADGRLEAHKLRGQLRIREEAIQRWLDEHAVKPTAKTPSPRRSKLPSRPDPISVWGR